MKNKLSGILFLVIVVFYISELSAQPKQSPLATSKQMVVVVTDSWDAVEGVLQYYERPAFDKSWKAVSPKTSIVVGKTGLAWGVGLHGVALGKGPEKKEGDGKSPAGVFGLSAVFGSTPANSAKFLKMPYVFVDSTDVCVDDVNSKYYNRILSKRDVKQDWKSAENMLDDAYKWGVVVEHNANPRKAGDGSCIFLHIWSGPSRGTAGCTALDEQKLLSLLRWLDPAARPVLVQLTKAEYQRLNKEWGLP